MVKKKQGSSVTKVENSGCENGSKNGVEKGKRTRKTVPRDASQKRSSIYRGVTRHRWTGRFEAHLWDKNCWNESQSKKGRQVYLGAYDEEEAAARAYDLAALKYWGQETVLNFTVINYQEELKEMEGQSKEEYIGSLRRKSSGFSRGVSKYRGVARHHHNGRWEARIGRVFGNKYLYLGTYATQEEAATAYDMAAIEYRGLNAVTNFDLSRYINWLRPNPAGSPRGTTLSPAGNLRRSPATLPAPSSPRRTPAETTSPANSPANSPATSPANFPATYPANSPESPPESDGKPSSSRCSFPEDIQTYFGCNDAVCFAEDTIFGDLNDFEAPIFCELDV